MRFLIAITLIVGVAGAVCLVVAATTPSFVDANGFLVEPFAWMASGRILLLTAAVTLMIAAGTWMFRRMTAEP